MKKVSNSLAETNSFAEKVVRALKKSGKKTGVLALVGDLGSGKTALTKCIAKALGVEGEITSPTFVLRNDYRTRDSHFKYLHHLDAYRIDDNLDTVGLSDILAHDNTLVVVEWADRISERMPDETITIRASVSGDTHTFLSDDL